MRHDGRSVNWDRPGYSSKSIVMEPGYDSSWACQIQIGTVNFCLSRLRLTWQFVFSTGFG